MSMIKIERAIIGVHVEPLRRHVPFAYCLFVEKTGGGDIVMLGQRRAPTALLQLNAMVGFAADSIVHSLASLAEEEGCASLVETKSAIFDALMPQATAFSFEDGEYIDSLSTEEVETQTHKQINAAIHQAKQQLAIIGEIGKRPNWIQEIYQPDGVVASGR
jgi:hypothetical protein